MIPLKEPPTLICTASQKPFFVLSSDGMSIDAILHRQKVKMLPVDRSEYQQIVVRRKHLWEDALHHFQSGINFRKYIRITFVGEPAVDDGGPLRDFFHRLMGAIATNNCLFHGEEDCRVPVPNVTALEKCTYQYVGEMIAVSLIHGGPSPTFMPHLLWTIMSMA